MYNILLVEDNNIILERLKTEIQKYSLLKPLFAQSYKEAMRVVREYKDDLKIALLDFNLPDAPDGQVVELVNAHKIPSIIFTASLGEKIQRVILKSAVIDYILKDNPNSIKFALDSAVRTLKNYDRTVLIVDDSQSIRLTLSEQLKNIKLNILQAADGKEALEMINSGKHEISLIFTDYEMPNMNGLELTFKLREKYNKDSLGIIAISANDDEEVVQKFLKAGANDYVNKPFSKNEIITRTYANLELIDLFSKIKDLSNKDFLTGSYNRRFFFDSGEAIFSKVKRDQRSIAVAMIDIDKFKNINDTYGHDVGDIALKEIKTILDKQLRSSDLVARFGGEEYCILLENISLDDIHTLFEKVRAAFENNIIDANGIQIRYTVSIGVQYGLESSLEEMIKCSDDALYYSKEHGRNRVTVNEAKVN